MALSGASFSTKSSILSLMSKMMTMPMIRSSATKNVLMNFLTIYTSSFLGLRSNSILLKSSRYPAHCLVLPCLEVTGLDVLARLAHKVKVESKIVFARDLSCEYLS